MDPNATMEKIERLFEGLETTLDFNDDANDLLCAIEDLQSWLSRGGFPPSNPNYRCRIVEIANAIALAYREP